ncbi:M23 family metallopeptidase [Nocardioides sp. KIGAM211]|uniref:M23 family metallopeptidase n=1 Tax=Nocardioides luti TaxID=2761101 RepID=A0A7X0RG02_9ACTN|nr:M23 family metallopeptidase [Nocardioides luti]MBB6626615.1 M23 family metallopeptidase [Nocardioides luti]
MVSVPARPARPARVARLARLATLVLAPLLALTVLATAAQADKRWVFYTDDTTHYTSPWFGGAHRIMVPFGCTSAPYYSPDPRCSDDRGFHHGLDIAMPCGTKLFSPYRGRVVSHDTLGPAYGDNPMLIRYAKRGFDLVIGHTRRVFLQPGDRVRAGAKIALASDNGAPDGCHLHFEKRAVEGGLATATKPRRLLALTPQS